MLTSKKGGKTRTWLTGVAATVLALCSLLSCSGPSTNVDPKVDESLGILSTTWPRTLEGIDAMRNALPRKVGDARRREARHDDEIVTDGFDILRARYTGPSDRAGVEMTNLREPGMAPRLALVTLFTTGLSDLGKNPRCLKRSYVGSLQPHEGESGILPGFTDEAVPHTGLPWFACRVALEGGHAPRGYFAAGWYSGEVVCVVYGSSRTALRELVRDLAAAWDQSGSA